MSSGSATIRTIQIVVSLGCLFYDIIRDPGGFHITSLIFIITVFDYTGSTAKKIVAMCDGGCGATVTKVGRVISWILVIILALVFVFVFPAKWTSDGSIDVEVRADYASKTYNSDDFSEFRFIKHFIKHNELQTEDNENQSEGRPLPPQSFYYLPQYLGGSFYVRGEVLCWWTLISCSIISIVDIAITWSCYSMYRKRNQTPSE